MNRGPRVVYTGQSRCPCVSSYFKLAENARNLPNKTSYINSELLLLFKVHDFGQLTLRKIIKIVATRRRVSRLKCTSFDFSWSSAPDPLAVLGGRFEQRAAGAGWEKKETEGSQVTVEPGPLGALL
jgi:hypothetical protein